MVPCLDIEILRRGKPILGDVQARRTIPQDHQPVWAVIRQRTEQQGACNTEDGGVRTNPNRQRQYSGQCEPDVLCEGAKSESNVQHPRVHWKVILVSQRGMANLARNCRLLGRRWYWGDPVSELFGFG